MGLLSQLWRRISGRWLGTVVTVTGTSMEPGLRSGDRALLKSGRSGLSRFDLVVLRSPGSDREDIKRIVGMPEELVEIRDGSLWIDGDQVEEPHLERPMPSEWLHAWGTAADEYVVLGDNRAAPGISDSRRYGPVNANAIFGAIVRAVE